MNRNILAAIIVAVVPFTGQSSQYRQVLDDNWKFRQARTVEWHNATVPGTVHTDLMANGIIPDPFVGQNERAVQWVDKEDWIYETIFDLDGALAQQDYINLVFDGLDTYADIYVNDSLILKADNMFRQWEVPVKGIVKPQGNRLRVYFHSPIKVDMPKFESLPFRYDACNDQSQNGGIFDKRVSVFARKAGYHYGWDWGPRLVTSGIWRPAYLKGWSGPVFKDIFITTKELRKNNASMEAIVEIVSENDYPEMSLIISDNESSEQFTKSNVSIKKGLNDISVSFDVNNPKLWWCNGLGEPNLYDFNITLLTEGNVIDERNLVTGIRQIDVVRDEDKDGRTFYFKLNGRPVFAKGANYIPCDNFLPRVTPEIYHRTVKDAADANMNMLRVWGGGIYEDDRFYHQCDSMGIMVWQDFMFACSLYPSEGELLDNIKKEAVYNVRRLRNHPCISLWCGNNECLEAWYNWGLKNRYEQQGFADIIWKQYVDLFHNALPEIVTEYNPEVFYWPSSPYSSIDVPSESDKGDTHMWRVWGGSEPVDLYNHVSSRFFSEYGFQSFPELETILKYAPDTTSHFIDSDVMLAHQRAGADANRRLEKYLLASYKEPKDFNSFVYMTQILQGDAVKTAIEAHRRNRPYCMGTLFWQHNDCWPVASWSSRDYYGKWKAQHYFAKKAFRDIMLSTMDNDDEITVYVVSDRLKQARGTLRVEAYRYDGTPLSSFKQSLRLPEGEVRKISLPKSKVFGDNDTRSIFVCSTFDTGEDTYDNIFLPSSQKDISLEKPEILINVREENEDLFLDITSDTFVRAFRVYLKDDVDYFLEDNYFDLLPGKQYSVKMETDLSKEEAEASIRWTSLFEATH